MKFLFLLLFLPWEVHLFKQIKIDYNKCPKEFFCLVDPGAALQPGTRDMLMPLMREIVQSGQDQNGIGILIKPLDKNKWLLILRSEVQLDWIKGLRLTKVLKAHSKSDALAVPDDKQQIVAGCNLDADLRFITGFGKPPFTFDMRHEESQFDVKNKKLVCVGVLKGTDIAGLLNDAQSGSYNLRLIYIQDIGDTTTKFARIIVASSGTAEVDFNIVNTQIQCDFERLKPLSNEIMLSHYFKEVDVFSESIDCKNNLMNPSDISHDLIIQLEDSVDPMIIQKITCESDNKLYYHTNETTLIEIIGDKSKVACGQRPKCPPPPLQTCPNGSCSAPKIECNAGKDKCEKIQCPTNHTFIYKEKKHAGTFECLKKSVEDDSGVDWFTEIDNERIRWNHENRTLQCYKLVGCQMKNPIQSICDDLEGCTWATFTSTSVYCPDKYDLKFKEELNGTEYDIDEFKCDLETGKWKLSESEQSRVKIVYCIYNEAKKIKEKVNPEALKDEEKEDDYEHFYIHLGIVIFTGILAIVIIIVVFRRFETKRQKKRKAYYDRIKDVKKWTRSEKYLLRPENRHQFLDEFMLGYDNLAIKDSIILCEGLWLDFNLYSVKERVHYLNNIFKEFGRDSNMIRMATPLLRKCTEKDEKWINERQPLHPATVRLAFCILKVLALCYGKRGKEDEDKRIRKIIGLRAYNIIFKLGIERQIDEDADQTLIRVYAIEALLFAGHQKFIDRLLKVWYDKGEKGEDMGTPLRKFVWGVAVRHRNKFFLVNTFLEAEIEKKKNGTQEEDDVRWGDKISHLIYALCASDRENTEPLLNNVIKDTFYTNQQMLAGFQAMLEVWDINHTIARFLFMERHLFIHKRMKPASREYIRLFRWIYLYVIYFPNKAEWLWRFITYINNHGESNFTEEEQKQIIPHFATATTFGGLYGAIYKFDDVVEDIELELSEEENRKVDERPRTPPTSPPSSDSYESRHGMHSPRPKKKEGDDKKSKANPKKDSTRNCSKRKTRKAPEAPVKAAMPVDSLKQLKERTAMERETLSIMDQNKKAIAETALAEKTATEGRTKKSKRSKSSEKSAAERSTQADKTTSNKEKRPKTEKRPVKKKMDSVGSTQED